jgi:hypothetical protein
MNRSKSLLLEGSQKLEPYLVPIGFQFRFGSEGRSCGGDFAWAEFVRDDRKLEIHFRWSLGLVRFHVGARSAFHETYMRELGVWHRCLYPGFADDPLKAFDELAHDLNLADDLLSGTAEVLLRAANKEQDDELTRHQDLLAEFAGDKRNLELLHTRFQEKRYKEVLSIARSLKYPSRMASSDHKMVEVARKKTEI